MDGSRRARGKQSRPQPPAASRLTLKARPNRRRAESLWTRVPKPAVVADACGRALRRSLPLVTGAGVLCAIGGTAWAGYRFVTTSPRFAITTIDVRGNQHVSTDSILATVSARVGDNVFSTNLDALADEVRANPWIANASVRRELPHTLVISVTEHAAAAIVQLGGLYLVGPEGHPFKRAELASDDGAGLPIVTGLDRAAYVADPAGTATKVKSALAALVRWRGNPERPSIGEVHVGMHGSLTLVTYEHAISIQLGTPDAHEMASNHAPDGLALRMQTFDATWAELSPSERSRTRAIHLDARPDHVTVALAPREDS
jgi:cell division septal protein FtsQ